MRLATFVVLALLALFSLFGVADAIGTKASAKHILVKTEVQAQELKDQIAGGADFSDLAKQHSTCPSGKKGGDLGSFRPGQMVSEFNDVVFNDEVGVVHGPVKTQFGYHLILITDRS